MAIYRTVTAAADEKETAQSDIEWARQHGLSFNGLYYAEELAGPHGANCHLFVPKGTDKEVIDKAADECWAALDVGALTAVIIPAAWIDELYAKATPDDDIMAKVMSMGVTTDNLLTWPGGHSLRLDPTTGNMLKKVFSAVNEDTQAKIRKVANSSPEKFMQVIDVAWGCAK